MTNDEINKRCAMFDDELTAYDFKYDSWVFIKHGDGSQMQLNHAFYMKEGPIYYVFTEHNGALWFHETEAFVTYADLEEIGVS